ncbi:MAG: 3-deoxy-manno-octulosonate cytidylyltransferase [Gammaproteobacteria bacterium]|jgi:3-deoxy-manno-octulosonate cytidylyltransferase (CMP-KDO synthetase)|nr:3-deoxy-manno-octulosonate cytidylyltransferase [Gammaproteobacteria bacterium]MDP6098204.1 3-deoxy-manno-octulosonate cytidylyltransferase [Gammaproteobacteria bacterium]HJO11706.1 3-deoxy-manno-octulosonate cytidylyltransferase [Gammaproteobacteria bacterium]|tara:strand:- start:5242 stop:5979 length:738 start_codon:yes stop_codon:yes gene_type:complete
MSFSVVIPARFASKRLPGKVLLDIGGKPMLQHVYERACSSNASSVSIATDDERVREAAEAFGAKVCMTSLAHRSGTDRIHEVAGQLGLPEDAVLVNVQGDEPLIPPSAINQVAANLVSNASAGISSLCEVIINQEEIANPNAVKVVLDGRGFALYFSRTTIPFGSSASAKNCLRHIGIYAYRVAVLNQFVAWPPSELEVQEKLEQLRALFNGIRIHMEISQECVPAGVDTEKDLETVRAHLAGSI